MTGCAYKNRAFRGAWLKGWYAASNGYPATTCPYSFDANRIGRVTWSRAFRWAWLQGYDDYQVNPRRGPGFP